MSGIPDLSDATISEAVEVRDNGLRISISSRTGVLTSIHEIADHELRRSLAHLLVPGMKVSDAMDVEV